MIIKNSKFIALLSLIIVIGFGGYFYAKKRHNQKKAISHEFFDSRTNNKHVWYLYAPGMMGTELMMGRYCPEFNATTGEKISWKSGGHVIGQPHVAVQFPELDLRKPDTFTLNPLTAFINELRKDIFPVFQRFFEQKFDFKVVDNPKSNSSVINFGFSFGKANIAQKNDIAALNKTYESLRTQHPEADIILYGDSRGAGTIFNFIATHKPLRVKAAVLDGIFDDVPHCIKHFLVENKGERAEKRMHDIVAFFMGNYNKKGPFPIEYAEQINDDIPLLLVTSLKDGLTSAQGAIKLYLELRNRSLQKVHLLVLNNALHPCYMIDNEADRELYETTVHAFYKHYELPYNKQRAQAGQKSFARTQPSIDELKKYALPQCSLCSKLLNR